MSIKPLRFDSKHMMSKAISVALAIFLLMASLLFSGCSSNGSSEGQSSDGSTSDTLESAAFVEPNAERSISDPEAPKISISVIVDPTESVDAGVSVKGFEEALTFDDLVFTEGDSALDALFDTGVVVTTSGLYVADINGLAAGAAGEDSGWIYEINGESPMMSSIDYRLADGDVVTWRFVTSFEG